MSWLVDGSFGPPLLVVYLGRLPDSGACRHKDGPWVSGFGVAVPDPSSGRRSDWKIWAVT